MRKTNQERRSVTAGGIGWALAAAVGMLAALASGTADARGGYGHFGDNFCSATTKVLAQSCKSEAQDDYYRAKALCLNVGNADDRKECIFEASRDRLDHYATCREQRSARGNLCAALGEARYEPIFEADAFDDDFENLTLPNRTSR
jgi:hypothetical protein